MSEKGYRQFPPGPFRDVLERAEAEVASWSPAKRAFARRATRCPPREDPCASPRRCDEAQTCVGSCGLFNRTGMR